MSDEFRNEQTSIGRIIFGSGMLVRPKPSLESLEGQVKELKEGLREALEWNWLGEDYPVAVYEKLRELIDE